VRARVLPLLHEVAGRDVAPLLARTAALLADDTDLLATLASEVDPIDAAALAGAPPAVARRAVRAWLGGAHPPDAASVERVLAVARGEVRGTEVAGRRRVRRTAGRLRLEGAAGADDGRGPGGR
jgi:tRNA(Ile)-lysidine synthase